MFMNDILSKWSKQSMATQADDKSPMVWTSEDIIDVFVLNSNLLNKHKHKHKQF